MPRPRGTPTRGGTPVRGSPRGGRGRGQTTTSGYFQPSRLSGQDSPYLSSHQGAISLADAAKRPARQDPSSGIGSGQLRKRPVTFISAGESEPLKLLEELLEKAVIEDDPAEVSPVEDDTAAEGGTLELAQDAVVSTTTVVEERVEMEVNVKTVMADIASDGEQVIGPEELEASIQVSTKVKREKQVEEAAPAFFFDTGGGKSTSKEKPYKEPVQIPKRPPMRNRDSDSSDEVLLFRGRAQPSKSTQPSKSAQPPKTAGSPKSDDSAKHMTMAHLQTEIEVVEQEMKAPSQTQGGRKAKKQPKKEAKTKKSKRTKAAEGSKPLKDDDSDAFLRDYIANLQENGEADDLMQLLNRRDLGGTETEPDSQESESEIRQVAKALGPVEAYSSESELDDETLEKLISKPDTQPLDRDSDLMGSDSDSDEITITHAGQQITGEEFDTMDWERPSLRRKKGKGARAQMNFGVSDSELEQALQTAWTGDRLKKSQRKQQREEMRALGLLGKKARDKPEDPMVKYPKGMTMDQISYELKEFLLGDAATLTLPPMDPHVRKFIHEFCHKFNIKSKSAGKGETRRPSLYRTKGTLPYMDVTFDKAIARMSRHYFPRVDGKSTRGRGGRSGRGGGRGGRGGGGDSAVNYHEGEVIGASAPELGVENRGRNMLEKMGWSTGTALGAMHNKGILQPVAQTMKKSKAGLG